MNDATKGLLKILCSGWMVNEDEELEERRKRGLKISSAIMQKNAEQLEAILEEMDAEDKK